MQGAGSVYFATLQGYVINETELYLSVFFLLYLKFSYFFCNGIVSLVIYIITCLYIIVITII